MLARNSQLFKILNACKFSIACKYWLRNSWWKNYTRTTVPWLRKENLRGNCPSICCFSFSIFSSFSSYSYYYQISFLCLYTFRQTNSVVSCPASWVGMTPFLHIKSWNFSLFHFRWCNLHMCMEWHASLFFVFQCGLRGRIDSNNHS